MSRRNLNNNYPATIIVFEGSDCSFKSTNFAKAYSYLLANTDKNIFTFKFPDYESLSSYMVRNYLIGEYDKIYKNHKDICDWKTSSLLYAMDRFDSFRVHNIWDLLEDPNNILLFDRYCTSNIMFQTSWVYELYGMERDKTKYYDELLHCIVWLRNLEQGTLGLPIEDYTIIMRAPVDKILEVLAKKENKDYIESDLSMIRNVNNNIDGIIDMISNFKLLQNYDASHKVNISQAASTISTVWSTDDNNNFLSEDALFDKVKVELDKIIKEL